MDRHICSILKLSLSNYHDMSSGHPCRSIRPRSRCKSRKRHLTMSAPLSFTLAKKKKDLPKQPLGDVQPDLSLGLLAVVGVVGTAELLLDIFFVQVRRVVELPPAEPAVVTGE